MSAFTGEHYSHKDSNIVSNQMIQDIGHDQNLKFIVLEFLRMNDPYIRYTVNKEQKCYDLGRDKQESSNEDCLKILQAAKRRYVNVICGKTLMNYYTSHAIKNRMLSLNRTIKNILIGIDKEIDIPMFPFMYSAEQSMYLPDSSYGQVIALPNLFEIHQGEIYVYTDSKQKAEIYKENKDQTNLDKKECYPKPYNLAMLK